MEKRTLSTGELARAAGVGLETIRYYERRGLLREPARSAAGHRLYTPDDLRRVRFVRRAQALGFTLEEINELLALRVVQGEPCDGVSSAADRVIGRIDQKVEELKAMRAALMRLRSACDIAEPTGHCPILDALEEDLDEDNKSS